VGRRTRNQVIEHIGESTPCANTGPLSNQALKESMAWLCERTRTPMSTTGTLVADEAYAGLASPVTKAAG